VDELEAHEFKDGVPLVRFIIILLEVL